MTGCLVSVVFLLLPSHLIHTACCIMLLLLLVLLDPATSRAPLHEYFFSKRSHKEFGTDYSYVDANLRHVTKAGSKRGADYAYEYRDSSEGFRSGAVDPEVGTGQLLKAWDPRFASVGSRMWKVLTRQRGLLGVRKALQTNILGRSTSFPLLFQRFQVSLEVTKEKKHHCGASLISK